jgi:pseudouridine synthase
MRLNKYLAENSKLSRRKADEAISNGKIKVNNVVAEIGQIITEDDTVTLDGQVILNNNKKTVTVLLNKPVGYVCSKDGQGSSTVYDLLPDEYRNLNIAGRLDKDSSGLVILTNDGELLNELTHPSKNKEKVYEVEVDRELTKKEIEQLKNGIDIGDSRLSKFKGIENIGLKKYKIVLGEGRNRQIRRCFEALENKVIALHRIKIGDYEINNIKENKITII